MHLTQEFYESVKPQEEKKIYWCDKLIGFGIIVYSSGLKRFVVRWRENYKPKQFAFGSTGMTVERAREYAKAVIASKTPRS